MYGMRSQSSAAHSCHQMGPWGTHGDSAVVWRRSVRWPAGAPTAILHPGPGQHGSAGSTPYGPAMDSQPYPPPLPSTYNSTATATATAAAAGAAHLFVRPNATFQNHVHGDAPVLVSQPSQRILSYRRSEHGGYPHLDPHHHTMGASGGGGLREVAVLIRGATAPPLGFPHFLGLHAADGGGHVLGLGLGLGGSGGDSDGDSGTDQAAAAGSTARRKRRVRARRDEGAGPTSAGVETADPLALLAHLAAGGAPAPRPRHHSAWEDATAALASLDLGSSRRQGPPARKRPRVDLGGGVDGNTGS
ncbi:hypothetical protein PLESTB_001093200 [Pleodorina starrii]|uniref:Uncharacterized protein n=1 Tax=Pleodorina starrii TaxID=330485 RepID=A0A9W6BR10_9CHLO|nr:hypothetical protein PLESTB_001093200 [Pleodorina starrii]